MKILLLNWRDTTHPKSGGAEQVTMQHLKHWAKSGHQVTLFTAGYNGSKESEEIEGVSIIRRGGSLTVYPNAALYLLIHSHEYDVIVDEIHAFPFFANFVWRTPVVAFIHEVAGEIWDYMWFSPLNYVGKFLEPLLLRFYGIRHIQFWTDAPSMKRELEKCGIPPSRITAIACPLIGELPKKEIAKNKTFTVIFLNRIVPMKGISDVLRAFSKIHQKYDSAELWIVGSGDEQYIKSLQEEAESLHVGKNITWWGKVEENKKYELLGKADILLHASVREGWGLVVLEAAAMGTPSVVYDVPGLKDVVKNNVTGIVTQKNLPDEMAEDACRLYEDKDRYNKYSDAGKKWVASLSWDTVTRESELLLQKAVSNK